MEMDDKRDIINQRFLQEVDLILEENKKNKVLPNSHSGISYDLFGNRNVINQVINGDNNISPANVIKFALKYELDLNLFFGNKSFRSDYSNDNLNLEETEFSKKTDVLISILNQSNISQRDYNLFTEMFNEVSTLSDKRKSEQETINKLKENLDIEIIAHEKLQQEYQRLVNGYIDLVENSGLSLKKEDNK